MSDLPLTFAYADPPYLGQSLRYPEHPEAHLWDDPQTHKELIERLVVEYPAGWLLSASSSSLHTILPFCPPNVRVLAWVKTFAAFKKHVNPAYSWEPIIMYGGRPRTDAMTYMRDWVAQPITLKKGLTGAKPKPLAWWMFDALNARDGDKLDDIFPGTGIVAEAWAEYMGDYEGHASKINRVTSGWEMGKGALRGEPT